MKALRYDSFGAADRLYVTAVPEPDCPPGGFRVRVHAASLNPLDWKIRVEHFALLPGFERPPRGVGHFANPAWQAPGCNGSSWPTSPPPSKRWKPATAAARSS